MNSLDTRFSRNVFEAVQKTRSTCFIVYKTTRLCLVVLNPDKTLLLVFQTLQKRSQHSEGSGRTPPKSK